VEALSYVECLPALASASWFVRKTDRRFSYLCQIWCKHYKPIFRDIKFYWFQNNGHISFGICYTVYMHTELSTRSFLWYLLSWKFEWSRCRSFKYMRILMYEFILKMSLLGDVSTAFWGEPKMGTLDRDIKRSHRDKRHQNWYTTHCKKQKACIMINSPLPPFSAFFGGYHVWYARSRGVLIRRAQFELGLNRFNEQWVRITNPSSGRKPSYNHRVKSTNVM